MIELPTKEDLAPGDGRSAETDLAQFQIHRVRSADEAVFELAYQKLWGEFGTATEVEQRDVLVRRLKWDPKQPVRGVHLLYEMIVVETPAGEFVAVRDHTAIVRADRCIVHLSHLLVDPKWRKSGVAGWMRAFPIPAAWRCLREAGQNERAPITLVAEMEHPSPSGMPRLKSYERAGFRKIDPTAIDYLQPDFRSFEQIDATVVLPLRMTLIVRRVGREDQPTISGAEVREIVQALYTMYAVEFREQDMQAVFDSLKNYPPDDAQIRLVLPTEKSE